MNFINIYDQVKSVKQQAIEAETNGVLVSRLEFAKESNDLKKRLFKNHISNEFSDLVRAIPDLEESKVRGGAYGLLPMIYRFWKRDRTLKKIIESYSRVESYLFEEYIKEK